MFKREKKSAISGTVDIEVLTPVVDKEDLHYYTDRLKIAIDNPEIRNIAICGNYGSGKSSIINTFKDTFLKDYNYLNVSLAGFKESKHLDKDIEYSLLQQFFYHVKFDDIPFSRFRRIKNVKRLNIWIWAFLILFYVCLWIYLLSPSFFEKFGLNLSGESNHIIKYIVDILVAIGTLYVVSLFIWLLLRIRFVHFKVSEYELNLQNNKNIFIFNRYLDELIYLFQSHGGKKVHVVILEDIDRLNNCSRIFTKLREINILLNQAKDIKNKIVFIYALKEDVFDCHLDKTKFFDYILSVIPKSNASNSVSDFFERFKDEILVGSGDSLRPDNVFLMDVAPFIPDLRSIKCIANDYFLFKDIMRENNLDKRKLLAMVVYKNIYPVDYGRLHENKGYLHSLFCENELLLADKERELMEEVKRLDNEIRERNYRYNEERLKNINELNELLVAEFLKNMPDRCHPGDENGHFVLYRDLFDEEYIAKILAHKTTCLTYNGSVYKVAPYTSGVNVDSYNKRKKLFENKYVQDTEELKVKKELLLGEIASLHRKTLKELCELDPDAFNKLCEKCRLKESNTDFRLLDLMVRKGYIAEDHIFYITIFKEGMMTNNDIEFLKNIHGWNTDNNRDVFTEKIDNPEIVLRYMYDADFSKDDVLNCSLVNHIYASGDKYNDRKKLLVSKITSYSRSCLDFVCRFLTSPDDMNSYAKGFFLNDIVKQDGSLWAKIVRDTDTSIESLGHIFSRIVKYLDVSLFKRLDADQSFSDYFADQHYLYFQDITSSTKFIGIIKTLNVKFTYIAHNQNKLGPVLEAIYKGCYYVLNAQNIDFIISTFGRVKYSVSDAGLYSKAMESGCTELKDYIKSNINDFVSNVYVDNNQPNDTDRYLIELINNETLSPQSRVLITRRSSNRLEDISQIKPQYLPEVLTAESCAGFNIRNLEYAYANLIRKQLEDWIIIYINNNSETFAACIKDMDRRFNDNTLADRLFRCNAIDDKAYFALLEHPEIRKDFPKKYTDISISHLELAIRSKVISLTLENWNTLKKLSTDIALELLLHNLDSLRGNVTSFGFSKEDLELILDDNRFNSIHH